MNKVIEIKSLGDYWHRQSPNWPPNEEKIRKMIPSHLLETYNLLYRRTECSEYATMLAWELYKRDTHGFTVARHIIKMSEKWMEWGRRY